jgi:4'-phosphopantetheinyl transferase
MTAHPGPDLAPADGGAPPASRLEPLGAGEVHAWLADPGAAADPAVAAACAALLSEDERGRHAGQRVEARGREYLVAHALARTALSRYRPAPPAAWRFSAGVHGRPEPAPPCGLRFSLTHCDGLVACAVAAAAVGIDAEPLARGERVLRLRERFCSPEELAAARGLGPAAQAPRALLLWTLKEAYAKARGLGMAIGFRSLTFDVEDGPEPQVRLRGPGAASWQLAAWVQGGHQLAVAVEQDAPLLLRARPVRPPGDAR